MAKAKRYSTEQIQAAQKQLCALTAKKSGKTKKEVVALLAEDVCKAVKEGHSLKDIQETLRQSDIPVSLARLKALLGETEAGGLGLPQGLLAEPQGVHRGREAGVQCRSWRLPDRNPFRASGARVYGRAGRRVGCWRE